jgi:WD40 repeat protein
MKKSKLFFLLIFILTSIVASSQIEKDSLRLVLPMGRDESFELEKIFTSSNSYVFATLDDDNKILVYNSITGQSISQINFDSLSFSINSLSISPNGRFILGSDNNDNKIALWRSWDGKLLKVFDGQYGEIINDELSVIFQDKSSGVFKVNFEILVDDVVKESNKVELFKTENSETIRDISFNKFDNSVLFFTSLNEIITFDLMKGLTIHKFKKVLKDKYSELKIRAMGPASNMLFYDNKISYLNNFTETEEIDWKDKEIRSISNTGNLVIYSVNDQTFLSDQLNDTIFHIVGQDYGFERITSSSFVFDNSSLLTASSDGTVFSWNTRNGKLNYIVSGSIKWTISPEILRESDNVVALVGGYNLIDAGNIFYRIWNLHSGIGVRQFFLDSLYLTGDLLPSQIYNDSILALCGSFDNCIYLLDIKNNKVLRTYIEDENSYDTDLASSRGEYFKFLAVVDNSVYYVLGDMLWSALKHKPIKKNIFKFLTFSDNQEYFLTYNWERKFIYLYETKSGKRISRISYNGDLISESFLLKNEIGLIKTNDKIIFLDFKNKQKTEIESHDESLEIKYFSQKFLVVYQKGILKLTKILENEDWLSFPMDECGFFSFSEEKSCFITTNDKISRVWSLSCDHYIYERLELPNSNWIVKIPNSNYYMCSKDASKMLHYVTPSLKVIGFDQLDPIYNRPDIVLDSIGKYFGNKDRGMIEEYKKAWEKRIERLGLDKDKLSSGEIAVPNADIVNEKQIEYEDKDGSVIIQVKANDPKYTLHRYNVLVKEVPIYGSEGISISELNTKQFERTDTIALSIGNNKIQVSVMNELGLENFKYPIYVNYTPEKKIESKTYYVGIGVNDFNDPSRKLNYCVKDVQDLAQAFARNQSKVDTLVFTNSEVTKENILALKSYLQKNTTVNDKVIISCSSHGLLDDSLNFYLATYDVDFAHPEKRGLAYEDLEGLLDGIPARQKLLLLDACNSGPNEQMLIKEKTKKSIPGYKGVNVEIVNDEINTFHQMTELFVNVRNNTGSFIIAASGGMQSAQEGRVVEGKKIENGAFTYSVLEYLAKEFNDQEKCTVNGMKNYVERRVEEITNAEQKPTSRQETMEVNWEIRP